MIGPDNEPGSTAPQNKKKGGLRLTRRPKLTTRIGFLVAVPTLAALGLYGGFFLRSMAKHPTLGHLIALLFLWQTQTAGAFAIAAAIVGAAAILYQVETTTRLAEEERDRRAQALWAVLPLALAELTDYATDCAQVHLELLKQPPTEPIKVTGLELPPLPSGLVDRLSELIEDSEPAHAKPLIALCRRVQVYHARMRDTQRRAARLALLRDYAVSRVVEAAEIHARCRKLIEYGRGAAGTPAAALSSDNVKEALFHMITGSPYMCELEEKIDRYAELVDPDGVIWPETTIHLMAPTRRPFRRASRFLRPF